VNATVNITHTFASDLDFTLTSPSGTVVTLSTDNGSSLDNVFAGTVFDDQANPGSPIPYSSQPNQTADNAYVNLTAVATLTPEEPLSAFNGENPNGVWTLKIIDDDPGATGTLNSWSLSITTAQCAVAGACMIVCPPDVTVASTDTTGAVVNYPAPQTTGTCNTITCTPASGSLFPLGTTIVTCTEDAATDGVGASCSFNVTVSLPFDGCCVDDATGDTFRQVVASVSSTDPLYGYWEYHVQATGETFTGTANSVSYRPNVSLVMGDSVSPATLYAQINFVQHVCLVRVTDRATGRTFTLRDRNTLNNMCATTPPPPPT
jgi:subtilisin-like proprotein convertase family protein